MSKITVIPATINPLTRLEKTSTQKRRVCGYARVSTDSDEQFTSYEAQVNYYTNYIKNNHDWEFVKVYTDEGISALSTAHRDGFNEMISDALTGKTDLIVTKSVSRFARNTVDSLTTIRKLKEHNVEVFFEKENIYTFDSKGELLLTIMSSLAQEESRSISENVTWGHRKRFSDGRFSLGYSHFLGYDKGPDGRLVINEEQAEVVRLIYSLFLSGKSPQAIADELEKLQIPTPSGKNVWNASTIRSILTNEKYKGDALLQKKFTVDFLQKKTKINEGEVQQYYIENSHEAIISPQDWEAVQAEIKRRQNIGPKYSATDPFASKIICGDCGSFYGHKTWHSTDRYRKTVWRCNAKFDNEHQCQTATLTEEIIKFAFIRAYNKLMQKRDEVIENCKRLISEIDTEEYNAEIQKLRDEMSLLAEQAKMCISENATTAQSQADYERKYSAISSRYEQAEQRLKKLLNETEQRHVRKTRLIAFIHDLGEQSFVLGEWSEDAWTRMVESVTVERTGRMVFRFKDGREVDIYS